MLDVVISKEVGFWIVAALIVASACATYSYFRDQKPPYV